MTGEYALPMRLCKPLKFLFDKTDEKLQKKQKNVKKSFKNITCNFVRFEENCDT